jgi:glutathione reductase (NADPH)
MRSTSNPRVFAVGDAAALGAPLTPVAIVQARVALANILDAGSARFEPGATPSVVFSDPVLASVGLTEAQAREDGLDVDVKLSDMSGWASSRRLGQHVAAAKTVVERSTGRILGAHLLGHGADEAVNVVAVAMLGGLTAHELRGAVLAYPTAGSDLTYVL